MSLKLAFAMALAATSIEAMPQFEPVAIQEATAVAAGDEAIVANEDQRKAAEEDVIQYSFVPEITGDLTFEPRQNGASLRGVFGITDYRGAFMYTTIAVALLVITAKAMGIAILPNLSEAVNVIAKR